MKIFALVSLCGLLPTVLAHQCADQSVCTPAACAPWSYEGANGPSAWGSLAGSETCGTGTSQSPINIVTATATPVNLGDIRFTPNYWHKITGTYLNDGDTVKFTPDSPNGLNITGGPYGTDVYQLAQFHFHWGCDDHEGSEHTINGKQFSLELHLVHYKVAYGTVAAAKSHADGLGVLGILFEADHSNHDYDALEFGTKSVECVRNPGATTPGHIDLGDFLKTVNPGRYYTYPGSLTTPDCDEAVIWTVFPRVITIDSHQLEDFRKLRDCHCFSHCNTFRPTQPIGSRVVRYNNNHDSSSSSSESHDSHHG